MFNEEIWRISQQNITLLKNFSSKLIPALEFSSKKYTQENGTSPNTPT